MELQTSASTYWQLQCNAYTLLASLVGIAQCHAYQMELILAGSAISDLLGGAPKGFLGEFRPSLGYHWPDCIFL